MSFYIVFVFFFTIIAYAFTEPADPGFMRLFFSLPVHPAFSSNRMVRKPFNHMRLQNAD